MADQEETKPKKEGKSAKAAGKSSTKTAERAPKGDGAAKAAKGKETKPAVKIPPRLLDRYRKEVAPALFREFKFKNVMQVPKVTKVIVNVGVGEALTNAKALDSTVRDITQITGQKPIVIKAKKSIATFKLRAGQSIGVKSTLRGNRMYYFLDRLMSVVLARQRDFRGVPRETFDGRGNYTLGLREQLVWPEIDYDQIDKVRGMEITIVTTAKNDEQARRLLQLMGMPFRTT